VSKPFDAVTKHLIEAHPLDWLRLVGIPAEKADVIDADVSSVTAAGDKVIRVQSPARSLVNLELQASYDADLPERKLLYHVLLRRRHKLPVRSVAILLRPAADGPAMTGELRYTLPDGAENLVFR
jgi:predicted transposase YdaD